MKRQGSLIRGVRPFLIASLAFGSMVGNLYVQADDSISLDEPAPTENTVPTANPVPSSAETSIVAPDDGGEVALDLAADGSGDVFNPYAFSRHLAWIFLPVFGLLVVALHLLPVPKRKVARKIDQANRFFRGISGEATATNIMKPKKVSNPEEGER